MMSDGKELSLLRLVNITKEFPGVRALNDVNFELKSGEVHVLFGENGAGKSTLISIVAGATKPTAGEVWIRGESVHLNSVHEAREFGISAVFQEFSLVPQMTVEENLFLGSEIVRAGILQKRAIRKRVKGMLEDLEFQLPIGRRVDQLTRAEQQMVEIAKAFRSELLILILDEPTASLTQQETSQLFRLINRLKSQNVGIIYITHRVSEIREIGDRITVLRDGCFVDTVDAKSTTEIELVRLMAGRVVSEIFPLIDFQPGETLLDVSGLHTADDSVRNASVRVCRGEIVGLAGLVGSGKSEFAQACFGALSISGGTVSLAGVDVTGASIQAMLRHGVLYLPQDRKTDGLVMMRSARENISLASLCERPVSRGWLLDKRSERKMVEDVAGTFKLPRERIELAVEHFSGGNQQKVMLARSHTQNFSLFVFDEPTVGVDVGTRIAIYQFIVELCKCGAGILLISSDLPEILHLTNRVYIFFQKQIQAELEGGDITEENVLSHFFEKAQG